MPFINVKLIDGVFSSDEKHAPAAALTDVLQRSKIACESIGGHPVTWTELREAAPPVATVR